MILAVALVLAAGIFCFPFLLSAAIRALPASRLLGGDQFTRDFRLRHLAVKTFLTGLAGGIAVSDPSASRAYSSLDTFEKPFFIEGAYAGLHLTRYLAPWRSFRRIDDFRQRHDRFIFLLGIGLGFAGGLKTVWSSSTAKISNGSLQIIDARLRSLFFNGYAFQKMVFYYRSHPTILLGGAALGSTERLGFYEGAGRALWFLVPDFADLQAALSTLPGECAVECLVGFGIATGFAGIQAVASGVLLSYPTEIRTAADFQLGLIVGLFARYYTSPDFVEQLFEREHLQLLDAVRSAARLFDELWARNVDYQEWRQALRLQIANAESIPSLQGPAMTTVGLG